jgi:predicted amidohydrolase
MHDIRIATSQFEHRDGDPAANLERVEALSARAAADGARLVVFHECCLTGYTFLQTLSREELDQLAEAVPDGPSVRAVSEIARDLNVAIGVGLIEREGDGVLRKCYAVVGPDGRVLAKHHKLHPFIHPALVPGDRFTIFDYEGVRFGILICYDNNLPENVRATALLGAEVVLMPHVTGCTPSPMPGRGTVARSLWENRERDPARLRIEFEGPKGRGWLMKWLPARAWENGVFTVFSNNVGVDHDTIKPGLARILSPEGDVLVESHALGDDVVVALCAGDSYTKASGRRYIQARRPELYGKLVEPREDGPRQVTRPGWTRSFEGGPAPEAIE